MHDPRHGFTRVAVLLGAGLAPILLAVLLAIFSDSSPITAYAVLFEPVWVGLAVFGILNLLAVGRVSIAICLALGTLVAVPVLHLPPPSREPPLLETEWRAQVARCVRQIDQPVGHVRVMTWRMDGAGPSTDVMGAVLALKPDIAVFTRLDDKTVMESLAEDLGGEVLWERGDASGPAIWVRGAFQLCGTRGDMSWTAQRSDETSWAGTAAFPEIDGIGVVPMIAFQVPMDLGVQKRAAGRIAALADLLGPHAIGVGHGGAPPTWRRFQGRLVGAGLSDGGGPSTWPGRILGLPGLPFQRLDRVMARSSWTTVSTSTLDVEGVWRPLFVEFEPALPAQVGAASR